MLGHKPWMIGSYVLEKDKFPSIRATMNVALILMLLSPFVEIFSLGYVETKGDFKQLFVSYMIMLIFSEFGIAIKNWLKNKGEKAMETIEYYNRQAVGYCHAKVCTKWTLEPEAEISGLNEVEQLTECEQRIAAESSGPTMKGIEPYYSSTCKHGVVDAIRSRVLCDKQLYFDVREDDSRVMQYHKFVMYGRGFFLGEDQELTRMPESSWLNAYDPQRRRLYSAALTTLRGLFPLPKGWKKVAAFQKFEPYLRPWGIGVKNRIISMKSHLLSAMIGPMTKTYGQYLKDAWHPEKNNDPFSKVKFKNKHLCYCTGMTRNQVGKVYDRYVEDIRLMNNGKASTYSSDMKGFDRSQNRLVGICRWLMLSLFPKPTKTELRGLKAGLKTEGHAARYGDVKFKGPPQLHTGSQGTSVWNTVLRGTAGVFLLLSTSEMRIRTERMAMERKWDLRKLKKFGIPYGTERRDTARARKDRLTSKEEEEVMEGVYNRGFVNFSNEGSYYINEIMKDVPWRMMVLGDDSLVITSEKLANALKSSTVIMSQLGMREIGEVGDTGDADFLSSLFMPASYEGKKQSMLTMKLGRTIVKTFWHRPYDFKRRKAIKYAKSIAEATLMDHSHIKWWTILCNRIIESHPDSKTDHKWLRKMNRTKGLEYEEETFLESEDPGFFLDFMKEPSKITPPVETPETREAYARHYGITDQQLVELEQYVSQVNAYNPVLDHPVLRRIVEVDLALPCFCPLTPKC
jgi:hypothetical protein